MISRGDLNTEKQNPQSQKIDSMSIIDILTTINREDQTIAHAVEKTIPDIEAVVRFTTESIQIRFEIDSWRYERNVKCIQVSTQNFMNDLKLRCLMNNL